MRFFVLLLSILFFFFAQNISAQEFIYDTYSLENGLPQSQIIGSAMCIDKKGLLWTGTNGGGMARLDGNHFTTFNTKDGLPSNQVWALTQTPDEKLWIASLGTKISYFDGKKFTAVLDTGNFIEKNLGLNSQFLYDQNDKLWFNTANKIFRLDNNQFIDFNANADTLLRNNQIILAALDQEKRLILSTTNGILSFNGKNLVKEEIDFPQEIKNRVNLFFAQDPQKNHWFVSFDPNNPNVVRRIFSYSPSKQWHELILPIPLQTPIVQIHFAKNGDMWIINILNAVQIRKEKFYYHNQQSGFTNFSVSSLVEDSEGNIWLSTQGNGIMKMPDLFCENYSFKPKEQFEAIFGLYEDKNGKIWAGGARGGVYWVKNGQMRPADIDVSLLQQRVSCFYEYDENNFFIGTFTGLYRLKGKKLFPASVEFGFAQGVQVHSFLREGNGIWVTSNAGVFFLDMKTGERKNIVIQNAVPNQNFSRDICKAANGDYWIGYQAGLRIFNAQKTKLYTTDDGLQNTLALQTIIDTKGMIWIVAYTGGLSRFDGKKFKNYGLKEGLSADLVYSITEDKNGNLWVGTQKGVDYLELDENREVKKITHINKNNGFKGVEMNGRSAFCDQEGNIWVGHLYGLSKFFAQKIEKTTLPKTYINKILLGLQEIDWKNENYQAYYSSLSAWFGLPENLVLPREKNDIIFKFSSSSKKMPSKVKFQWKLDGLHKDWQPITDRTEAVFSNLAPQKYIFRVRSCNANGEWGESSDFEFFIAPAFWETWWFRILAICVLIVLVWVAVKARINSIEAQKRELEQLVQNRTVEIAKQRDQILEKNVELEQQKEEILAQQEELNQKAAEIKIAYDEIQEQNTNIKASITYAKRIQEVMLPRQSEIKKHFTDLFLLFKPRDIVSGDFYWFAEINEKLVIAVMDCTGHGVPGAFMAMAGDAYLNLIVNVQKCTDAGTIFTELHKNIYRSLKQNDSENRDGMDGVVCVIDKKKGVMQFSGAKNPLIYIEDNELKWIKGNKFSIGGRVKEGTFNVFETHTITLQKNTWYYLYSDGYQDQFGGEDNRKFMSQNFRNLLLEIHTKNGQEKLITLENSLKNWIGDNEQIDDITVLGFNI